MWNLTSHLHTSSGLSNLINRWTCLIWKLSYTQVDGMAWAWDICHLVSLQYGCSSHDKHFHMLRCGSLSTSSVKLICNEVPHYVVQLIIWPAEPDHMQHWLCNIKSNFPSSHLLWPEHPHTSWESSHTHMWMAWPENEIFAVWPGFLTIQRQHSPLVHFLYHNITDLALKKVSLHVLLPFFIRNGACLEPRI